MIGENSLQIYKIFKLPVIPLKESKRIKKRLFGAKPAQTPARHADGRDNYHGDRVVCNGDREGFNAPRSERAGVESLASIKVNVCELPLTRNLSALCHLKYLCSSRALCR
jgi:hypothetical protein